MSRPDTCNTGEARISHRLTRDLDERAVEDALVHLSADERARQARFVFPRDRRDFAAAHLLLRQALSAQRPRAPREWTFVAGRNGKPALARDDEEASGLSFNLAHTAGLVACVVTHGIEVGIDVEGIAPGFDDLELARRYFSPVEVATLERCDSAERRTRFTELWTLKEAFVKATGDGLSGGTKEQVFLFDGSKSLRFQPADRAQTHAWRFALFSVDNYRLAVALHAAADKRDVLHVCRDASAASQMNGAVCLLRMSPGLTLDST